MTESCRYRSCDEPRREDSKFCSDKCEVKWEHIKADARDAKRSDMKQQEETMQDAAKAAWGNSRGV